MGQFLYTHPRFRNNGGRLWFGRPSDVRKKPPRESVSLSHAEVVGTRVSTGTNLLGSRFPIALSQQRQRG